MRCSHVAMSTCRSSKERPDTAGRLQLRRRLQEKPARECCEQRFLFMKESTKDKIEGTLHEAKGKVKEESGKAIGNPDLQDRGTGEKVAGKVQKKVGDVEKVFEQ